LAVTPSAEGRGLRKLGHQKFGGLFSSTPSDAKKTREPFAAGGLDNPAAQFREFTAECLELAEKARSPERRRVYLDLARVCFQLALRCEKGSDGAL
jgi:hypothetical protein